MRRHLLLLSTGVLCVGTAIAANLAEQAPPQGPPRACIDPAAPGWRALQDDDFAGVNGDANTWTWKGSVLRCSGTPMGVLRTREVFTNFELVVEWRHLRVGGNSGLFVWVPRDALMQLPAGKLPESGIEVQMLDHGYREQYEAETGKKGDWFTSHGDVFPVGKSKLSPFEPRSPNGERSFPRKELSRGARQWNHYYVRGINGELRLWVNGEEVSGGREAKPRTGHLCLESEGSPVEFRNIRIRELP
jgi:hypothetical protein